MRWRRYARIMKTMGCGDVQHASAAIKMMVIVERSELEWGPEVLATHIRSPLSLVPSRGRDTSARLRLPYATRTAGAVGSQMARKFKWPNETKRRKWAESSKGEEWMFLNSQ